MPDSETAAFEFCKQRLHIAQDGFAGGRIAHVAHRGRAGQAVNHFAPGESVTDQAETALRVEAFTIEGDDAGCFLTSVLEGVQAQGGDGGRVRMAENAKHPTFFTQAVGVGIELRISHGACGPVGVCASLSRSTCPGLCQRQFRALVGACIRHILIFRFRLFQPL